MSTESQSITLPQYDPNLKDLDGLTGKQRAFADHYLILNSTPQPHVQKRGFGTQACRLAGYQGDDNVLAVQASRLLRLNNVREFIRRQIKLSAMGPDEVLARLSKQARASFAHVLSNSGEFSLKACKKRGTDDLLRKVKIKKTSRTDPVTKETVVEVTHELELHNSQSALELLGKFHKLFTEKLEIEDKTPAQPTQTLAVLIFERMGVQLSDEQAARIMQASVQRAKLKIAG